MGKSIPCFWISLCLALFVLAAAPWAVVSVGQPVGAAAGGGDEVPRSTFTGQLNHTAARRAFSLTCPVYASVGEQQVKVADYDLPLVLPEGSDVDEYEKLAGKLVKAGGYLFNTPRQFLVIELREAETTTPTAPARPALRKESGLR